MKQEKDGQSRRRGQDRRKIKSNKHKRKFMEELGHGKYETRKE